ATSKYFPKPSAHAQKPGNAPARIADQNRANQTTNYRSEVDFYLCNHTAL
ncbi:response regulator, partial [Vibrio parahaemolyticus V-223/04]